MSWPLAFGLKLRRVTSLLAVGRVTHRRPTSACRIHACNSTIDSAPRMARVPKVWRRS